MFKLIYLITILSLISGCGNLDQFIPKPKFHVIRKLVEPTSVYYKPVSTVVNGKVITVGEPWVDYEDFILVIEDNGVEVYIYTFEEVYAEMNVGDPVFLLTYADYFFHYDFSDQPL